MGFVDWCIVVIPLIFLLGLAFYSKRYTRGIVDYLAAGRIAGRYVLSVGDLATAMSVIGLVAGCESGYQTGFSVGFWGAFLYPISLFLSLTGFVVYRWRETRCLSMGQFLELRYGSKFFRIFCAVLRTIAEMVTNAIGPAIATNFFIYYLGLPHRIMIGGINLPCYALIVTLCLTLAVLFIWPSGRVSLLITDCFQGLLCYPIFVLVVGYVILKFSWFDDIAPVMLNRVPGQSFLNPYDVQNLRDFNLFSTVVSITSSVLCRGCWIGNDNSGAAKTAHEQKMAGVLGSWRGGFSGMMIMLISMISIVFMTSVHFSKTGKFKTNNIEVREVLCNHVLGQVVEDDAKRAELMAQIRRIPSKLTKEDYEKPLSQEDNRDTPYLNTVRQGLGQTPAARYQYQKFRSLYHQMMMPTVLSKIFPKGMLGLFCLLMIMFLISTDDSRIFNASSTLMQDLVLPLYKGHLDPKLHLLLLRLMTVGVAVFFFIVSIFFAQLDYITMFTTIMCAVWTGGAGPIILFGLYSRFGNLAGAWGALIFGSGTSLVGLICQRNWTQYIYPFLEEHGLVNGCDKVLRAVSGPLEPWISWHMDAVKFPINSYEIFFLSMMLSLAAYIGGSYLFYKPYNLDKLLHRGKYSDGPAVKPDPLTIRNAFRKIIGITPEYTTGDKIIAYSIFFYSVVYGVGILFFGIVIWNAFYRWPNNWWVIKFYITSLVIPGIAAAITTVWFLWGGIRDLRRLFIDLKNRIDDPNDNGQVTEEAKKDMLK